MNATPLMSRDLAAPDRLGLDTRIEFRKAAVDILDALPEGTGQLHIDLSATRHVDSAGLGVLMLVQRRAAERRQVIVLHHPNDQLRFLLAVTKLAPLFELDPAA